MKIGNSLVIVWNKNLDKHDADFDIIGEDMRNILKKANILEKKGDI